MKFAYYLFGAIQALTIMKSHATSCLPDIEVDFDGNKANVESSKDLSNVVVYDGCTKIKYDNLSGYSGKFYSENLNNNVCAVWVKSGCNSSGDGPGYGEKFEAPGECKPADCGTKKPTTSAPVTQEPTTKKPTTSSPVTAEPTTKNPTTSAPVTAEPTTKNPTTSAPVTSEPTTKNPTTSAPVTAEPTTKKPTTSSPVTAEPTTKKPTTLSPTTKKPTKKPTQELYANLMVVLDRSGSISDQSFNRAKSYVINNINCNKPRIVCVIAFAQKPQLVVPCTTNMIMVKKVLNNLKSYSDGTKALTNLAAAMKLATDKMPAESKKNTLLLFMSDARPNLPGYGDNNLLAAQSAKATAPAIKKKTLDRLCVGLDNPNNELLYEFCDKTNTMHITNPNKPGLCPRL